MALAEVLDLACPFAGQERTDRIDKSAARPHQLRADFQQPRLDGGHPIEAFRSKAPAPFRIAPPGAAAAAGCVDEDEVGFRLRFGKLFQFIGRGEKPGSDFCACPLCARRKIWIKPASSPAAVITGRPFHSAGAGVATRTMTR